MKEKKLEKEGEREKGRDSNPENKRPGRDLNPGLAGDSRLY